jgi:hypothetical protein
MAALGIYLMMFMLLLHMRSNIIELDAASLFNAGG